MHTLNEYFRDGAAVEELADADRWPAAPAVSAAPRSAGLLARAPHRLRDLCRAAVLRAMAPLVPVLGCREAQAVGILVYHRVTPGIPGVAFPTWNVAPVHFRRQLLGLRQHGWQPWPLRKVLEHHRRGDEIPRNVFVVTFDDGYENVYRYAWPVLKELDVPATVFLATAYLDSPNPFPFDDWPHGGDPRVPRECWRPLSTAQCAEMLADGRVDLGAHTHTHRVFRDRPAELIADLHIARDVLRERFALADATFAFPWGNKRLGLAGGELAAAARRAGMLCSLTTEGELVRPGSDPFDWGRFLVYDQDTAATIGTLLSGWYSWFRGGYQRLRRLVRSGEGRRA